MYADRQHPLLPGESSTPQQLRIAARHYRVVYVGTRKSEEETRSYLTRFGRICWSGAHTLDANSANHFFVEMADQTTAEAICAEQPGDFYFNSLVRLPTLIGIFDAIAPPDTITKKPRTKPRTRRGGQAYHAMQASLIASGVVPAKRTHDDAEKGGSAASSSSAQQLPTPFPSSSRLYAHTPASFGTASGSVKQEPPLERIGSFLSSSSHILSGSALHNTSSGPSSMPSSTLAAPLPHERGRFDCDSDALPEDPTELNAMLTKTFGGASDRDKWMVVAVRYRGLGNLHAAIAVLSAMVSVFTSPASKLSKDYIKPAFLMLASCHTDLSRQIRELEGLHSEASALHLSKAQEYLQTVYGTNVPPDSLPDVRGRPFQVSSEPNTSSANKSARHQPVPNRERGPRVMTADELDTLATLKRDVQSLRDRQKNVTQQLAIATEKYSRLENELGIEKAQRQKAENALADSTHELAHELDGARRSAKFAVDQCKREVENRRRLEGQVAELREELDAVKHDTGLRVREAQEKERAAREYLARMGNVLGRAAQGDFEEQPGLGVGRHGDMAPPPAKRPRTSSVSSSSRYGYETASRPNSGTY